MLGPLLGWSWGAGVRNGGRKPDCAEHSPQLHKSRLALQMRKPCVGYCSPVFARFFFYARQPQACEYHVHFPWTGGRLMELRHARPCAGEGCILTRGGACGDPCSWCMGSNSGCTYCDHCEWSGDCWCAVRLPRAGYQTPPPLTGRSREAAKSYGGKQSVLWSG